MPSGRYYALFLLCAHLLMLTGCCGYRFGDGGLPSQYGSISVPFVVGDADGNLTAVIVEELVRSGVYDYRADGGALLLLVQIVDIDDENIGFRYDRQKSGKLKHEIIPVETRLTALAQISLVEAASGTPVLGPVRIKASVDFDHDYYSSPNAINIFSLGQLSDYDEAYDAAYIPLNRLLAQKIVDFINDSW